MQFNLKVKVLKKSKDAPYPEHIIVERKSTHELVHMSFKEGTLAKFTHVVRDPETKMVWNEQEKKYNALPPSYHVAQEFSIKDGKAVYSKGPENQNFFCFFNTPPFNLSSIAFCSCPEGLSDFSIDTDLQHKCKPIYIHDCGVAEIKEVYPHLGKRTCLLRNINQNVRS